MLRQTGVSLNSQSRLCHSAAIGFSLDCRRVSVRKILNGTQPVPLKMNKPSWQNLYQQKFCSALALTLV
jgi:hypothetical protein